MASRSIPAALVHKTRESDFGKIDTISTRSSLSNAISTLKRQSRELPFQVFFSWCYLKRLETRLEFQLVCSSGTVGSGGPWKRNWFELPAECSHLDLLSLFKHCRVGELVWAGGEGCAGKFYFNSKSLSFKQSH